MLLKFSRLFQAGQSWQGADRMEKFRSNLQTDGMGSAIDPNSAAARANAAAMRVLLADGLA